MWPKQYLNNKSKQLFRGVDIGENIADVTDINEASEVDALQAEMSHSSINAIWSAVEGLYRTGMYPGVAFCLRRHGHVVLNRALGYARGILPEEQLASPVSMTTETPACLYSASKAVMAMTVHKLAEEGHVNLLNPVAYYLPEFGKNGKKNISIYQMLAHRGGFPMIEADVPMDVMFDRERILDIIYNMEAMCPEGRVQAYHAVTSGFVADELIRKTTGKTINEYLKEKIADPMGMKNFTFGVPQEQQMQVARNYVTGMKNGKLVEGVLSRAFGVSIDTAVELSNSKAFMEAIVPSANLYATAEEVGRFYQMLLDMGRYGDRQIFDPLTIQKAIREAGGMQIDKGIFLPMRFSAGFMLGGKPLGMYGLNTHHAFGHLGFANIFCWADRERDIAVSMVTTGKPILGNHILALPKVLHTISKECSRCENMAD